MEKVILLSIQPKWLEKILNGQKTIEIRKTMPKCELPIDVYLYCCKSDVSYSVLPKEKEWSEGYLANGKIVAKFTLNKVVKYNEEKWYNLNIYKSCVDTYDLYKYAGGKNLLYGWYIDNLVIFDKPLKLSEFNKSSYEQVKEKLETIGCECKNCSYAIDNSILGDDGHCDFENCPKLIISKAPQSWCYAYKERKC